LGFFWDWSQQGINDIFFFPKILAWHTSLMWWCFFALFFPFQITPKVLRVWARILCAVPNSRLVVKCKPFCCDSIRHGFLSALEQLGVEPVRVDLLPLILLNHDHMQAYALMDVR